MKKILILIMVLFVSCISIEGTKDIFPVKLYSVTEYVHKDFWKKTLILLKSYKSITDTSNFMVSISRTSNDNVFFVIHHRGPAWRYFDELTIIADEKVYEVISIEIPILPKDGLHVIDEIMSYDLTIDMTESLRDCKKLSIKIGYGEIMDVPYQGLIILKDFLAK